MKIKFGYTPFGLGVIINVRIDWVNDESIFMLLEKHNHDDLQIDLSFFKSKYNKLLSVKEYKVPVMKKDMNHGIKYEDIKNVLKLEGYLSANMFQEFYDDFQDIKALMKLYKAYEEFSSSKINVKNSQLAV